MTAVPHVAVIGAGVAGLAAALELSGRGLAVTVIERAPTVGGKLRQVGQGAAAMDAGPTVFTLRGIFDELFERAATRLSDHLRITPLDILARHAWSDGQRLDLFADRARTEAAIAEFAGGANALGYRRFCADARRIYETLERAFLRQPQPSLTGLLRAGGLAGLAGLWRLRPFESLWQALDRYFPDPRLRQLFGRYATYCGSSPFLAPATLMLVAHVEQQGVWQVEGGLHALATSMLALLRSRGVTIRLSTHVSALRLQHGRLHQIELHDADPLRVDAAILTGDVAALTGALFGREAAGAARNLHEGTRSLSALTWNMRVATRGFRLTRHNVFFSDDYAAEFTRLVTRRQVPHEPTVYVCAQDRETPATPLPGQPERLMLLINAPPTGDRHPFAAEETAQCLSRTLAHLRRCGLELDTPAQPVVTTPADFNRLYPGTGGALYGPASHGWQAAFRRAGSRSPIPGLYLAGGSTHPGPGLPMAALSGRHAAACLQRDLDSN